MISILRSLAQAVVAFGQGAWFAISLMISHVRTAWLTGVRSLAVQDPDVGDSEVIATPKIPLHLRTVAMADRHAREVSA